MSQSNKFSRRAMLAGLGASAAMLPLLHAEKAPAAATGFPKRLVTVTWTNGVMGSTFYPTGTDLTLGATLAPLEPYKSKIIMPVGLDQKVLLDMNNREYDGHFTFPCLFTGTAENVSESRKPQGPSVDQVISDAIAKNVKLTAPLLNLGVRSQGDGEPTSWKGPGQKNVPETDPSRLFTRLFAGASVPAPQVDALLLRRKSILDFLGKDLEAYGTRLGTEDRAKIQAHLTAIRDLEKQLEGGTAPTLACTPPSQPAATKDTPTLMKLMFEMAGIALTCDHTRVITIDLYDDGGGDGNNFPWLGISDDYHTVAHAGGNMAAQKTKIDAWIFSQVALMLAKLDGAIEGNGTALDNTVVVTANDMDDGANHYVGKIPFVLIGSCGGYFKTGRVIKYSKTPHNRLLVSLCNAMDVPIDSFGAAGYGGALTELTM
jgi:hypothetical protein